MTALNDTGALLRRALVTMVLFAAAMSLARAAPAEGNGFAAGVAAQYTYDNNLFRLPNFADATLLRPGSSRQDHITTYSVIGDGEWTLGRQLLSLDLRFGNNRFVRNTDLNNNSASARAVWDWTVTPFLLGDVGAEFTRALASFANERQFGRDLVQSTHYFGNFGVRFANHLKLVGGVRYTRLTHSLDAVNEQNFRTKSGNAGIQFYTSEADYVGVDYRYSNSRFAAPTIVGDVFFDPDSNDSTSSIVLRHALGGKTSLDAAFGYLKRHYLREDRGSFSGQVWHATVAWQATAITRVDLSASRGLTAALEVQSDYFVSKSFSISPVWTPTPRISLALSANWSTQDYLGASPSAIEFASRKDRVASQQANLQYQPRDPLTFVLSFKHEYRDSNVPIISYNDKLIAASVQFLVNGR